MLVLSRTEGETIVIDGKIRVTIVEAGRGRARLAIDAPAEVVVDRLEVHERKIKESVK